MSQPTLRSVSAKPEISPCANRGRYLAFCLSVPKRRKGSGTPIRLGGREENRQRRVDTSAKGGDFLIFGLGKSQSSILAWNLDAKRAELANSFKIGSGNSPSLSTRSGSRGSRVVLNR